MNHEIPKFIPLVPPLTLRTRSFPPELPEDGVFFLSIPNSPVTVKFWMWHTTAWHHPQSEPLQAIQQALAEGVRQPKHRLLDNEIEWVSGTTAFAVLPEEKKEYVPHELSWQLLMDAIAGFRGFVVHYPGVYPKCEIYYVDEHKREEWVIGQIGLFEIGTPSSKQSIE